MLRSPGPYTMNGKKRKEPEDEPDESRKKMCGTPREIINLSSDDDE